MTLTRAVAASMAAIAGLWLVMSLTYPFGWDQGLFAWVGGVVVRGGLPYVDAWDFKGPLVYYTYALAEVIFGAHLWSIRVLDAILLAAGTLAVVRIAEAITVPRSARWTGLVFFLWYASHSFWHTAQPDGWTAMLLSVGLMSMMTRQKPYESWVAVLAGLCVGITSLFKPINALFLVLPAAHIAFTDGNRRTLALFAVLLGWAIPIAGIAAWFAVNGALGELIDVHLRYAAVYLSLSPGDRSRGLVEYFLETRLIAVALPAIFYGWLILWRINRANATVLGAWFAIAVLSVAAQNRFYAYHWLPILPAATILGAIGIQEIGARIKPLGPLMLGVILLHCAAPVVLEEARFVAWVSGILSRDSYYDAYGESSDDIRAATWFRERAKPGKLFVFGWHSVVPWLSERETVSRFGYSLPLAMGRGLEITDRYRAEAMTALSATPPQYILVGRQPSEILGDDATIADFPELEKLLARDYREVQRFGTIAVYEFIR